LSNNVHPREVGHKQIKLAYGPLQKFRARAAGVQGYAGYSLPKVLDNPLPFQHKHCLFSTIYINCSRITCSRSLCTRRRSAVL